MTQLAWRASELLFFRYHYFAAREDFEAAMQSSQILPHAASQGPRTRRSPLQALHQMGVSKPCLLSMYMLNSGSNILDLD